jgi:hypothetical protein
MPRSMLVTWVLRCLAEHPHDTTATMIAARLGELGDPPAVEAALEALREEHLVDRAGAHYALTTSGWAAARRAGVDAAAEAL